MTAFLQDHWLDITTTVLGLAYILLEYRASVWLWGVGLVMQILDVWLYYDKGLYADCGMEFYYIAMTVYGYANWKWLHRRNNRSQTARDITHFDRRYIAPWLCFTLTAWLVMWYLLEYYTDSTVPVADAFTTALSFVGIWALARKYLEQWLIWIVVDVVTAVLYFQKDIPFKASLYTLYVVIAIAGYLRWRKMMVRQRQEAGAATHA